MDTIVYTVCFLCIIILFGLVIWHIVYSVNNIKELQRHSDETVVIDDHQSRHVERNASKIRSVSDKVNKLDADVGDKVSKLDADVAAKVSKLDADVGDKVSKLDADVAAKVSKLGTDVNSRVDKLEADMGNKVSKLDVAMTTKLGSMETAATTSSNSISSIGSQLDAVGGNVTDMQSKLAAFEQQVGQSFKEKYKLQSLATHPDDTDGAIYMADGQMQVAVDDLVRLRNTTSKQTGIQFDTSPGPGDMRNPNGQMKITRQGIMFGGPNSGKQIDSAQISAGRHVPNSLNVVGMSSGTGGSDRRVDVWAEGGLNVNGYIGLNNIASHPDNTDGAIYRADGQMQVAVDDLVRLRHTGSKQTGIQFDTQPGPGDMHNPNGQMKISRQGIMFGGPNAGKEANSAQISAGRHIPNSLNIVGMSSGPAWTDRRVDVWAEGGMNVYGQLNSYGRMNANEVCINGTCLNQTEMSKLKRVLAASTA
jgi:phage host-nuclease inhibitor protein Gam